MNLEKRAYERKHIVKLKTQENQYLEEPKKILCQMENFYKTLDSSQISENTFNSQCHQIQLKFKFSRRSQKVDFVLLSFTYSP